MLWRLTNKQKNKTNDEKKTTLHFDLPLLNYYYFLHAFPEK